MSAQITIVGLGSGDENQISLGIWKKLQSASHIYVRTAEHPALKLLWENHLTPHSFDAIYEEKSTFAEVYEAIVTELIRLAKFFEQEIIYAIPGHPMVAEQTTQLLRQRCQTEGIELQILGGESFLDQAFLRFGFDPIEGFQLLDATQMRGNQLQPQIHTLIAQVYDTYTASDLKLNLMELYPDDYPVIVGHALGVAGKEIILKIPLYELDRIEGYGNLSLVWVPRSDLELLQKRSFHRLHEIVEMLRSPGGCPWDLEQTHASIRNNLIEETYEVLETIDDDDPTAMCEELGDLLLQVMLHAQMEQEAGAFTVYDVIAGLNEKLIRRHPHVFGSRSAGTADEALIRWQEIKREEKLQKGQDSTQSSALSGVPRAIPSLLKAWKLQKKAAQVGFDWENLNDVIAKLEEELSELKETLGIPKAINEQIEELGDVLFSTVNVARFLKIDPEEALALTNRKFTKRFHYIEEQLRLSGKKMDKINLEEMERYWQEAKNFHKPSL